MCTSENLVFNSSTFRIENACQGEGRVTARARGSASGRRGRQCKNYSFFADVLNGRPLDKESPCAFTKTLNRAFHS